MLRNKKDILLIIVFVHNIRECRKIKWHFVCKECDEPNSKEFACKCILLYLMRDVTSMCVQCYAAVSNSFLWQCTWYATSNCKIFHWIDFHLYLLSGQKYHSFIYAVLFSGFTVIYLFQVFCCYLVLHNLKGVLRDKSCWSLFHDFSDITYDLRPV